MVADDYETDEDMNDVVMDDSDPVGTRQTEEVFDEV